MKKNAAFLVIVLIAVALAGCGGATSSGNVLVDINGNKITEGDLNFLGEINPRIKAQIVNPTGKKRLLDNLVEQEILYQEAVKEGVNRDPKVKAKVDLYRRVIIAQSLVEKEIEKSAKKYYDDNQGEFKKLKLSHIMVKYATPEQLKKASKKQRKKLRSEKEALRVAKKLKGQIEKGKEFSDVARKSSEDLATKSRGGDLGLASKDEKRLTNRGFEPLLEKAFTMKVGQLSGPIKTSKGYHIVTVTRGIEVEPYEQAQRSILFKVRGDARRDLLANLKKESTIVYPEEEKKKEEAKKMAEKKEQKVLTTPAKPAPKPTPTMKAKAGKKK